MLTNIPDNTPIYMLAPKCAHHMAPEPQRLENILLHHTDDGPRFSVTSDKLDRQYRHYIHLRHLVNYYGKYVSWINGYADRNPLEFLFLAEGIHKDRSLKDLEADRLEDKDFDEDYNCEWCAPRACGCGSRMYEEEEAALPTLAPPPPLSPKPEALDVAAIMARLQSIEKKMDAVLACHEMLRQLEAIKLDLK